MKTETKVEDLSLQEEQKIHGGRETNIHKGILDDFLIVHPTLGIPKTNI